VTQDPLAPLADAVLAAAATAFADVPGVEVVDEGDLVRSFAPGRPYGFCNSIARVRIADRSFVDRVAAVEAPYRPAGLPTSWWVSDETSPVDAGARLAAAGLADGGSEAVMATELHEPIEHPEADDVSVWEVDDGDELDEWIEVIAASYGWQDAAKAAVIRGLYDPAAPHGRSGRRVQVLARLGGRAVGAASLFETAGVGWVTNVGTIPEARGRGVGAAVTLEALRLARERGFASAYLAASAMGEPVYARIGFRVIGRLSHLIGPGRV
jgi:GNAT superfamily N-acetyltransferase